MKVLQALIDVRPPLKSNPCALIATGQTLIPRLSMLIAARNVLLHLQKALQEQNSPTRLILISYKYLGPRSGALQQLLSISVRRLKSSSQSGYPVPASLLFDLVTLWYLAQRRSV